MDLGSILGRAFADEASGLPQDTTATRILDAAVSECGSRGIGALTIDGVARRAGVNRVTVYRRFGDRDSMLQAMTLREGRRMAEGILEAISGVTNPADQLVESFVAAMRLAEAHPVIRRTAEFEPQDLIAAGLADGAALLVLGSTFIAAGVRRAQADGMAVHLDADQAGETMARLFASFILLPAHHSIDVRSAAGARDYARRMLVPLFLGESDHG